MPRLFDRLFPQYTLRSLLLLTTAVCVLLAACLYDSLRLTAAVSSWSLAFLTVGLASLANSSPALAVRRAGQAAAVALLPAVYFFWSRPGPETPWLHTLYRFCTELGMWLGLTLLVVWLVIAVHRVRRAPLEVSPETFRRTARFSLWGLAPLLLCLVAGERLRLLGVFASPFVADNNRIIMMRMGWGLGWALMAIGILLPWLLLNGSLRRAARGLRPSCWDGLARWILRGAVALELLAASARLSLVFTRETLADWGLGGLIFGVHVLLAAYWLAAVGSALFLTSGIIQLARHRSHGLMFLAAPFYGGLWIYVLLWLLFFWKEQVLPF